MVNIKLGLKKEKKGSPRLYPRAYARGIRRRRIKSMKGEITYKVLKFIEEGIFMNLNFFEAVAVSGYGASYKKLEFEERRIAKKRKSLVDFFFSLGEDKTKVKRKLSRLIYLLKKDDLIIFDERKGIFSLTVKGREYIEKLSGKLKKFLPNPKIYKKESGDVLIIIAFDIPEKEAVKRHWLCSVLKNLGFKMRQKSVWIGKTKIPKILIQDLSRLGLLDFIDIFEVIKKGTLEEI